MRNRLILGQYNAYCDSCGFKFKNVQLRLRYDGFMVCKKCWHPRNYQELLKARTEDLRLPFVRDRDLATNPVPINYSRIVNEYVTALDTIRVVRLLTIADTVHTLDALSTTEQHLLSLADTVHTTDNLISKIISSNSIDAFSINTNSIG